MGRVRGTNGQFVRKGAAPCLEVATVGAAEVAEVRSARRARIPVLRNDARRAFARALPLIIEALIERAMAGSVAHVRLLIQVERELLAPTAGERKGKSLEAILMEQWRKDAEEYGPR